MSYTIDEHRHRFSAWAAGRAASVKGCRFEVEAGKRLLEAIGLNRLLGDPELLPAVDVIDRDHKVWRGQLIDVAKMDGIDCTHGVAAKLINVYLKAAFVCGGYHSHERVKMMHPPIDSVLLDELSSQNVGGYKSVWNEARRIRWSKLNSEQYEKVISYIRKALPNRGLWEIERYWRGHQ